MYDTFSADYDRFVNWPARLAVELPFIEQQLNLLAMGTPLRVLDAACGTGMHAIALAQHSHRVAGADLSAGMIARARANAEAARVTAHFETAGFGELAHTFEPGEYDALLCLGNSLPHVLTPEALTVALSDFAACLRPGGLLLIQNRNFDFVLSRRERWMEPQSHHSVIDRTNYGNGAPSETLFLRFYDFDADGLLTFNIITLHRQKDGAWKQQISSTRLWPQRQSEIVAALMEAQFIDIHSYGNMTGAPFEPQNSGNLVITARKQ